MDQLIKWGVFMMWLAVVELVLFYAFFPLRAWQLIMFVATIYLACGTLFSNSSAQAFSIVAKGVGTASALYTSLQVLLGAVVTAILSCFPVTSTIPLAIGVAILSSGLTVLSRWSHKNSIKISKKVLKFKNRGLY